MWTNSYYKHNRRRKKTHSANLCCMKQIKGFCKLYLQCLQVKNCYWCLERCFSEFFKNLSPPLCLYIILNKPASLCLFSLASLSWQRFHLQGRCVTQKVCQVQRRMVLWCARWQFSWDWCIIQDGYLECLPALLIQIPGKAKRRSLWFSFNAPRARHESQAWKPTQAPHLPPGRLFS